MGVLQHHFHGGRRRGALLLIAFEILECDATELFRIDILNGVIWGSIG